MTTENDNAYCRFLPNYEVEHRDCSDYANGVVTSVLSGKIVARMVEGKRIPLHG